jgi:hypothetical protein
VLAKTLMKYWTAWTRKGLFASSNMLALALLPHTCAAWAQGSSYANLTFTEDGKSFVFAYGTSAFRSFPGLLANLSAAPTTSTGTDAALGSYSELTLPFAADGELAVRYYAADDAFVFVRRPKTAALPALWPAFSIADRMEDRMLRCIGWQEHYFFPGSVMPRNHTGDHNADIRMCDSGGPLFTFQTEDAGDALALSPVSHFSSQGIINCPPVDKELPKGSKAPAESCSLGVSAAINSGCREKCLMFQTQSILLARPGITRTTRAFGASFRRFHSTTRARCVRKRSGAACDRKTVSDRLLSSTAVPASTSSRIGRTTRLGIPGGRSATTRRVSTQAIRRCLRFLGQSSSGAVAPCIHS